ncbi:DB module [Oesophagostomum dentatum]|uniref:DB module n=1 Tax=Oesophagostomum dentatum TaxID=61180 RepID=A0A0B1TTM0_OESDE|nr:DB module [Oesophagostomum dentatum]
MLIWLFAALSSTTYALTANEKLIRCCQGNPEIDAACAAKYCQIPAIAPHMVVPFIAECSPRGKTVSHVWDCLSSRHDHTACCQRQGVIPLCMAYCKADGPVPTDMLKYGICIGEFEKYRMCFRTYLKHHPSYRGDQ